MSYGTLTTLDNLQGVTTTISQFGEQVVADTVANALAVYNRIVQDNIADFAFTTSDNLLPYGVGGAFDIMELDQGGAADASKITGGGNVGLPLREYGGAVQFTRDYMDNVPVGQLTDLLDAAAGADLLNIRKQITRAIFKPTNNNSYVDVNGPKPGLILPIKAFLNADGATIPNGPNGETFDGSSHTHYTGVASLTEASLNALLTNVVEHGVTGSVRLYIARADEAAVRGFTGSFTPYYDGRLRLGSGVTAADGALDPTNPNDRAIGLFSGAEVWVKPWVPANYQVAFDSGSGNDKGLGVRTPDGTLTGRGGFGIVFEHEHYPLRGRQLRRKFGVAPVIRHKVAVQQSNNASYTNPSIP